MCTFIVSVAGRGIVVTDDVVSWGEMGSGMFQALGVFRFSFVFLVYLLLST